MSEADPLRPDDPREVGPYRLTERLGMGGQGVVYLGSTAEGTPVAVKLLREELAADPRVRERFMKEIAAARRVDPFCIAQVLDASLEGPRPYIVTEYIEGPSLQQAGARESAAAVQRLAVATATALAAIHGAGIVHRDFKPSNVLLGPDGPRVIDFGIARDSAAPLTMTSSIIGTPAYMAPEQFAGEFVGPAADVFAWGAVVAFAATGKPPFGADSLPAIMHRVLQGEPKLGELSEPLRSLVVACLAKDPAQRPTMQDVVLRLLSARSASTGPQSPMSGPQPLVSGPQAPVAGPQPQGPAPQPPGAGPQVTAPGRQPLATGPQAPAPVTRPSGAASPPLPMPVPGARQGKQGSPGQNQVLVLAVAAAVVLAMVVITTGVIFWPEQSDASNSAKGNGSGSDGSAAGTQNGTTGPNPGNAGNGGKGQRSGSPSPNASGSPSASGKPKPGSSGRPGQPGSPAPKPSSGGGGGGGGGGGDNGGGGDSGGGNNGGGGSGGSVNIISLNGDCNSARYYYGYAIREPSGGSSYDYGVYVDGSRVDGGSHSAGSSAEEGQGNGSFNGRVRITVTVKVSGPISDQKSFEIWTC